MNRQPTAHRVNRTSAFLSRRTALAAGLLLMAGLGLAGTLPHVHGAGPDQVELYQMALTGDGASAVEIVISAAQQRGGWAPAPDDEVVFDSSLARNVRGEVTVVDQPPFECGDRKLSRGMDACQRDFTAKQNLVRLGSALFATPLPDGGSVPRPSFDDVLSTYVEEVGHSWQEYLFETDGQGGQRLHATSWEDGLRLSHGWEYQAKAYILSLDGDLLTLSAQERAEFYTVICDEDGYANPLGHVVPAYGPPPGWPNPAGWPLSAPTPDDLAAFCAGR